MNETTWTTLAFSARGRIDRRPFWIVTGVCIAINIVTSILSAALDGHGTPPA